MPSTDLVVLDQQLTPLVPRFAEVLGTRMPVERLVQTVKVSCERNPRLLECDRQSLFNAAMTAAVLALEVDGVTGQAHMVPFKDKAQLIIGYRGWNTLAARSGYTITGAVVREGDEFEYELGTRVYLRHRPKGDTKYRITHAWATATSNTLPPIISVLTIDEVMAVKARAPGAKKSDSPWNDPTVGFVAMAEKTAKRRLARSLPLNLYRAATRLDEAVFDEDRTAWIDPARGLQIEGEAPALVQVEPSPTPSMEEIMHPPRTRHPDSGGSGSLGDIPVSQSTEAAGRMTIEAMAKEAAMRGRDVFQTFWNARTPEERVRIEAIKGELAPLLGPKPGGA